MKLRILLISTFLVAHSSLSFSAEINIDSLMAAKVQPWLNNELKNCIAKVKTNPSPIKYLKNKIKCESEYNKFKTNPITNLTTRSGSVRYAQITNSPIPSSIKTRTFIYKNCSSTPVALSSTEKITSNDGLTITTKDSVKTSIGATVGFKVGVEIGLSASRDVSFEKQQTTTQQSTKEYTLNISKNIPPYTTLLVSQDVRELYSWFDFEGDLFLDGLVALKEQYVNIVPNNSVTVKGEIFNTSSELSSLAYQEVPLAQTCNVITTASTQKSNASQNKITAEFQNGSPILFTNGMSIATPNQVGNVQVRVKSLGNDYCKVNFYSSFGTYTTLARPHQTSEWENLLTYTSAKTTSLSGDSNCKSGFVAEIRY